MDRTRAFLSQNKVSFNRYTNFEDHHVYYYAIDKKITADNCIETCKSLIEGLSKTVLSQIDLRRKAVRERFETHELKSLDCTFDKMAGSGEDFTVLFRQAVLVLSNYHQACQKDLMNSLGKDFCKYLTRLRNDRGDMAHGRAAPKIEKSTLDLAYMIENITDLIAFHMLEILSLIDFSKMDEVSQDQAIIESFMFKEDFELEGINEGERTIREFNESLDKRYPFEGKALYSRALYDQYQEDYEIQLQEYIDNKEQELME
ncbi:hypothetical protein [Paraglaciecola sp.]|uniref:hypothetical protein n=1 Tax=Paraglaciecola sp. TaxID=1920173 RepID=UPI0030F3E65D